MARTELKLLMAKNVRHLPGIETIVCSLRTAEENIRLRGLSAQGRDWPAQAAPRRDSEGTEKEGMTLESPHDYGQDCQHQAKGGECPCWSDDLHGLLHGECFLVKRMTATDSFKSAQECQAGLINKRL